MFDALLHPELQQFYVNQSINIRLFDDTTSQMT